MASHDQRLAACRTRLAHLGGIAARTEETERRILAAAEERRETVSRDLATLRPRVLLDPAAAEQYQALTLESGQLSQVVARASAALGTEQGELRKALPAARLRTRQAAQAVCGVLTSSRP